jgi:UDP-glucose 4-epimerase
MGRSARLLTVPPALLRLGGLMTGKMADLERLTNSLQVDIRHTCTTLDWRPPKSVDEGLCSAAQSFLENGALG